MSSRPETPPKTQVDPRVAISQQLERALQGPPFDPHAICQLGSAAFKLGMAAEADRAFGTAINILLHFIGSGDAEAALSLEIDIYKAFVTAIESEAHYERCFALWREPMIELGRKLRNPAVPASTSSRKIGFVFQSGSVLGHTEVLFRLLESRDRAVDATLYVIGSQQPDFSARAQKLGVPVVAFPDVQRWSRPPDGLATRVKWVGEQMAKDGVGTAVWVSIPANACFAFAMRMAPVQVMWSLRYHPVRLPEIDGYLTYGSWSEEERIFHGQTWTVCPVPLALDPRPPDAAKVAALRARFPNRVLLGTLAREEKIASLPFLQSVVEVLRRNPECGFVWTGREHHAGIAGFFQQNGVAERCHFVGWVDTPLYAAIFDVFLETFPLGCGITGYQAMGAGVPLVSYLDSNTVFGMQYWSELLRKAGSVEKVSREMLDAYPVLCARNPADYADIVTRVIADQGFRDEWKAREARFYEEEISGIARYSKRFFGALEAVRTRAAGQ